MADTKGRHSRETNKLRQNGLGNVAKVDANIPLPLTIEPREGQVMTFEK